MEFFTFIVGIIILVFLFNLRNRIQRLEQAIKNNMVQYAIEPNSQFQPQQIKTQQQTILDSVLDYIKQQLAQGVNREEIKNSLIANGWQIIDIEKAFSLIVSSKQLDQSVVAPEQIEPVQSDRFINWLKEDWILKLGALLLLIGFGWLTTYAFLNNWIGPMGRITLGIIAGVLFLLFGWWRIKKYIHQGSIFLILGSTTILLTIFAAREIYDFFTPFSALAVMFLSTAFVAFVSVKCNSRSLALASLILAGIAPLFTNAPTVDYVGLFLYLLIVVLGTIWIVILTGERVLTIAALLLVVFYSLPHIFSFNLVDIEILLFFAYAFATIFFLTNTIGILKSKGKEIFSDLIAAAGNGLLLLAWIMTAAQDEWKSLIIAAWMIVFVTGAFLIFRITQRREPFYVYAGISIAMLAAATSAELKGSTLVIAYIIESGIISLITHLILKDIKITERINLLLIGPAILSLSSITSSAWAVSIFNKDFFVLLILGLVLLGLGLFFLPFVRKAEDKEPRQLNTTMLIIGSIYCYALLWLSLHTGFQDDNIAKMISLVIYTIIGLICYFYGLANMKRCLKLYGGTIIGLIVIRLFLIDIGTMSLTGRIITFFLIGALLISTAFIGKKKQSANLIDNTK